jgi:hypothetical protein
MFATTCFAFAAIRFIEEFIRFCINYISNLTSKKKEKEVVASEYKRLVATVTVELYSTVKAHCDKNGVTPTQFTFNAVTEKLKREEEPK